MTNTPNTKKDAITYQSAGVDIDKGNAFINTIKSAVSSTKRQGADTKIGGFGGVFDLTKLNYQAPLLIAATDGVGTKLKIALETNDFTTIGIDLVAMCVNDLIVQGAEPLFFLDYYATGKLDINQGKQIVEGIAEGCRQSGAALIGGETAEMPGLYHDKDFDLAGFSVGIVEKHNLLPKMDNIQKGDCIIALPSNGVHSNGYSLVRKLIKLNNINWQDTPPFSEGETFKDAFLKPTKIYVKDCLGLLKTHGDDIKALAHITGGGLLENIPRVLPEHVSVPEEAYDFEFPPLFQWLQDTANLPRAEMLKTFNCGFGMALIVSKHKADAILNDINDPKARILAEL